MKFIKKYWASITLFALASLAIAAIFVWPNFKDAFTALITVSIPTAILSLEMKRNKDQFSATNKLNKIGEIRSQGARLIEALNQDDLVKLQNDFRFECNRADLGSVFYSKLLMDSIKPLIDKLTIERLKLELIIPQDKTGTSLKQEINKWTKVFEDSILNFQSVICYMSDKSVDQMTYEDFDAYYGNSLNLKEWASSKNNSSNPFGKKIANEKDFDETAFVSIAKFGDFILDTPSREASTSDVQTIVMDILSKYCNSKENEILYS